MREGVLFPRWCPEFFFGYGYPLFNYYAPLSVLLTAVLGFVVPLPAAIHLAFGLAAVAGAMGAFLWLRPVAGWAGALIGSAAITFAPFHVMDVYYRGGLPEFMAMALFPWVLWALRRLHRATGPAIAIAALLFAGVVLAHNVMALLFAPVALVYGLAVGASRARGAVRWRQLRDLVAPVLALVLGVAVTTFFWLPALAELDLVRPQNLVGNPLVDFRFFFAERLVSPDLVQVYGRWQDSKFSYAVEVGLVQTLLAVVGLVGGGGVLLAAARRQRWTAQQRSLSAHLGFAVLGGGACVVFTLAVSLPLWEVLPLLPFVQYPTRFLGPLALFAGVAASGLGPLFLRIAGPSRPGLVAVWTGATLLIAAVSGLAGVAPRAVAPWAFTVDHRGAQLFETMTQTIGTTSIGEYVPRSVQVVPTGSAIALDRALGNPVRWITTPDVAVLAVERGVHRQRFDVELTRETAPVLPIVAFAGWQLEVNGIAMPYIAAHQTGLLQVATPLPPGRHVLVAQLGTTSVRRMAEIVSWCALLALVGLLAAGWRRSARGASTSPPGGAPLAAPWRLAAAIGVGTLVTVFPGVLTLAPPPQPTVGTRWGDGTWLALVDPGWVAPQPFEPVTPPLAICTGQQLYLHLADSVGAVVAQYDQAWPGECGDVRRLPLRPFDALDPPPGAYHLRLGPYSLVTGRRAPLVEERLAQYWVPENGAGLPPVVVSPRRVVLTAAGRGAIASSPALGRVAAAALPDAVVAGQELSVALTWADLLPQGVVLSESLQLLDGAGRLVAQLDRQPAGGAYPTTAWIEGSGFSETIRFRVPPDAAAGAHTLVLVLYEPVRGERVRWHLDLAPGDVAPPGPAVDAIRLGTVTVTR